MGYQKAYPNCLSKSTILSLDLSLAGLARRRVDRDPTTRHPQWARAIPVPGVELGRRLPALVVRCRCTPPHPPLSRPVGREGMQPTSYCADHIFPKLDFDAE